MLADVSLGSLSVLACLGVLERCRPQGGKSFTTLRLVSESRLSLPAASCHAPVAPDCLIGTFQVRGPDKPGQSAQTVIHLFSSRRCSCPLFLRSPRGIRHCGGARVILRQGKGKINDKWLGFFMEHNKKRTATWLPYWPIFLSIIQRRLQSETHNKGTHWEVKYVHRKPLQEGIFQYIH